MDRLLAIIVLVLSHAAPLLSRRLHSGEFADFDRSGAAQHVVTAEHRSHTGPTASAEKYTGAESTAELPRPSPHGPAEPFALLPTPNIATPVHDTLISWSTHRPEPHLPLPGDQQTASITVVPRDQEVDWFPHKHHRKTKVQHDDAAWTKFPNMKHLVEIVPIKHKSKTKGKTLAYIVPKSHSVKKKLNKHKKVAGIVVDRDLHDLSNDYESSEENANIDSSESKSSDSDSESMESNSSVYEYMAPRDDHTDADELKEYLHKGVAYNDIDASEDKINDKLNDIVSYFNQHKDLNIDSLFHDVLPDNEVDPEYHVHYIIHKKHHPKNNHKNHSIEKHEKNHDKKNIIHVNNNDKKNIIHVNNKPQENNIKKYNTIHVYPQSEDYKIFNRGENHHTYHRNHQKVNEKSGNLAESPTDSLHKEIKHDVNFDHDMWQSKHEVTQPAHLNDTGSYHSQSYEDLGEVVRVSDGKNISSQQIHDFSTESKVNQDLSQLYEISADVENDPAHGTETNQDDKPQIQLKHANVDSNSDGNANSNADGNADSNADSNSDGNADSSAISDDFENHSPDFSNENYSDSLSNELSSDESQSAADVSESNVNDSVESSDVSHYSTSGSEHSSHEDILQIDIPGHDQSNYHYHVITTEKVSPEFVHEHGIIHKTSQQTPSSESIEPNSSHQHSDDADITLNDLSEHDFIFPNCLKLKKKKVLKKCDKDCEGQKTYTLTFLFNR